MDAAEIEGDSVARLERPAENAIVFTIRVNIGHGGAVVVFVEVFAIEALWLVNAPPVMGPSDALQRRRFGDGIEGNPEAHALLTLHAVIGRILMPRRDDRGPRFLYQHVVVEEPAGPGNASWRRR